MIADGDSIYALSSGRGPAGVAVIRLSGPAARLAIDRLAGPCAKPRFAALRRLRTLEGWLIDEALVLWFQGPQSETGEDMAEFQVHGGRAVVAAVLAELGRIEGCRPAEAGEFARRAFWNGKIDLTAVEGLADLIEAETEAQRRQAVEQASGALAQLYGGWRTRLIEAGALVEAAIDFSDEADVSTSSVAAARTIVEQLASALREHIEGANRGEVIRTGYQVVLAGAPNAGKSSLLNALARRDVAIVSEEAGTTRDVIEVKLDLAGYPVVVSDTAGIREAEGGVEREGIRRSLARARQAELVIWLTDSQAAATGLTPEFETAVSNGRLVHVASKIDRGAAHTDAELGISAVTGEGLDRLTALIAARAAADLGSLDAIVPTNERQRAALTRALRHLEVFLAGSQEDVELRGEDLRLAALELGRLTGRIDAEHVLDQIFSRFCIGK